MEVFPCTSVRSAAKKPDGPKKHPSPAYPTRFFHKLFPAEIFPVIINGDWRLCPVTLFSRTHNNPPKECPVLRRNKDGHCMFPFSSRKDGEVILCAAKWTDACHNGEHKKSRWSKGDVFDLLTVLL